MPGPLPKYPIQLTRELEGHLQHLSPCYTAPFAAVQRARILLLAHQQPLWRNAEIARQVGGCVNTVRHWRQRWPPTDSVRDAPRAGTRRTFTRSSGPRLSRWPVVRHAHTANPGRAGRGRHSPRSPSHSRAWRTSRRGRSGPGCARTRATLGALTRGSTRLLHTVWTRPRRCASATNTPRRWPHRGSGGVQ